MTPPTTPPPNPVLAVPFLPWKAYGHLVYFGPGNGHKSAGGFSVAGCPDPDQLAAAIVATCNASAPPPETAGDVEQLIRALEIELEQRDGDYATVAPLLMHKAITALRSLASVRAERDAAHEDAKACSIQLTEMHTRALRVERELTSLRSQVEGMREALTNLIDECDEYGFPVDREIRAALSPKAAI